MDMMQNIHMMVMTQMRSANRALLFVLILGVFFSSCEKKIFTPENVAIDLDVPYSDKQAMDIYYFSPSNSKKPVLVFVHGGGWSAGNKSEWDNSHANMFLENGIINISINYGLSPHPNQINDVAKAVRWVYDNIDKYGGDKNKIYIMGFSAGAHLVALLCTDESYLKSQNMTFANIKGVCSYDGGNYMYNAESIVGSYIEGSFKISFGSDVKEWKKALPYHFVEKNKNIPPFLLVAEQDVDYRRDSNIAFAKKLRDNGYVVEDIYIPECTHGTIFYNKMFETEIKEQIINFFR